MPERDPGSAAERTALAWTRTGLTAIAVGALALKVFPPGSVLGRHLLGLALCGLGAWALVRAQARAEGLAPSVLAHRLFTLAVVVISLGTAVAVTVP